MIGIPDPAIYGLHVLILGQVSSKRQPGRTSNEEKTKITSLPLLSKEFGVMSTVLPIQAIALPQPHSRRQTPTTHSQTKAKVKIHAVIIRVRVIGLGFIITIILYLYTLIYTGQISQQWSIKKKMFLAVVVLMFILACCGLVTLGVVKCWLPRSNVANVTRVISENHTVGLGNLPYDSVNITALDPNQYHHTVDIYQLHCGAITNRTYHSFACDSTPLVVSHFSLDNFLYLVAGSVVEYVVSVISAPRYSVMKIFLFNNKEDSDSFINSETVPHALFNQSLTVRENGTTFPPVSFPVTADTYVYPAASVSAPMNLTICNNYTMVEYNIPQMYAENCTIQSSSDSCNFTLGADTCLFAYTHVKGPEQTSQASLIVQGTREATTPEYCVGVEVGLGLIIALLIILIIFALICRYKHTCTMSGKRCSDTSHGGTAPDTYAYTGNNETAYQSIQY